MAIAGADPNLSPKGYDTLAQPRPQRLVFADQPGSGTAICHARTEHGRISHTLQPSARRSSCVRA
jgi:hypothetical protein